VSDQATALRLVAERLSAEREAFVTSWARWVRSSTTASEPESLRLCGAEAEALITRLSTGALAEYLIEDAASAAEALRAGKGLHLRIAATRVLSRCAAPFLEGVEGLPFPEALLATHEVSLRRMEGLLRVQDEEWARRLAEAQDQAAGALERAHEAARNFEALRRSEGRSQHRAEQLALLSSVTHKIAGILDPERLMQEAATILQARMNHTYVAVVTLDAEGALVGRWAGRTGVARESAGRAKGAPKGIIGRALRKRAPQVVPDVARDADYHPDVTGTRSEMVVPLMESGEVVGALDFQSEKPAAFDLDDVVAAEVLAEFLIVALRNARLFASRGPNP
jgi:putative methionine-R-sulfoxide reductase with GAF domain